MRIRQAGKQLKFIWRLCLIKRYKKQDLYRNKSFLKHVSKGKQGEEISIQFILSSYPFMLLPRRRKKEGSELAVQRGADSSRYVEAAAASHCSQELHSLHRAKINSFTNLYFIPDV